MFYKARARQIITHACVARDFNFLCLCYVNYSNFYSTIRTCTVNLFKKWRQPCLQFLVMMNNFSPLSDDVYVTMENDESISVTELCVLTKIKGIKASRASGPDGLPNWVLKEYAELFAALVAEILNTSFKECMLPNASLETC